MKIHCHRSFLKCLHIHTKKSFNKVILWKRNNAPARHQRLYIYFILDYFVNHIILLYVELEFFSLNNRILNPYLTSDTPFIYFHVVIESVSLYEHILIYFIIKYFLILNCFYYYNTVFWNFLCKHYFIYMYL